ncbi:IPT/TIG domain-containing protein, partial [Candidatus Desantisbacteria bacterium]|nr:IPT/TIG domain-containing protein [Candidatus Desantisbacteria bacterium]
MIRSMAKLAVFGLILVAGYGEAANNKLTLVSPIEGTIGTTITIIGEGYGPTETVRVDFGGRLDVARVTTSEEGTFTAAFQLTPHPAGQAKFICVGYKTLCSNESVISIKGRLTEVIPENGRPGTEVRVTGDGYASAEDIQVSFGDNENILINKANGMGAFDMVFTVDCQPAGKRIIKVKGLKSEFSNSEGFEITGGITSVEPGYGSVGTKVKVSGAGFGAGEKIKIDLGNISNIADVTADKQGEFTSGFAVLSQAAGVKTIMATGLKSHQIGMDRFVVSPVITLISPTEGFVGTIVKIQGNGFASSESIRVDLNRSMGIGRGQADEMGRLSVEFVLDAQPGDKPSRIGVIGRESRRPCYMDTFKIW